MDTLGERIKAIRTQQGLTQLQFGELFGLSRSHISNIETNGENPSDMFIRFVAYRYGLDYEFLKTGKQLPKERLNEIDYNETRAMLDNFIKENIMPLDNETVSHFRTFVYKFYYYLLKGNEIFEIIGYDSEEYKTYLNRIGWIMSTLGDIVQDADNKKRVHHKGAKYKYDKYQFQASYLIQLNNSIFELNALIRDIADVFFKLNDLDVKFEMNLDSDVNYDNDDM